MVFPLGWVINALAILAGGALGLLLHGRLPEKMPGTWEPTLILWKVM